MPEVSRPEPPQRRVRGLRRLLLRLAAAAAAIGLTAAVTVTWSPAAAVMVTKSGSCVDGGGVRWDARVDWGDTYRAADGTRRVTLDSASWTTTRPGVVPTDSTVRTLDGDGTGQQWLSWTGEHDYQAGRDYKVRHLDDPVSAPGRNKVTVTLGLDGDGLGDCTVTFLEPQPAGAPASVPTPPAAPTGPVTNLPAQPASLVYGDTAGTTAYAQPGGLVVAGRDNYQNQAFKDVSAGGGTVLIYLDPVIDNPYGRYHQLLNNSSECGPATSRWPGNYRANSSGYLNDFRVGSVLQNKLRCVLEVMVRENPHMAGFFADDVGSRSWFPGVDWSTFPDKAAYRAGAVALTQTLRAVANEHGLIFLVNGTWSANDGGGYPDVARSGTALADGGFVEHHDGELRYFGPYGCSDQWAAQSPVTRGNAVNYAVTDTVAGQTEYAASGCYAYVSRQTVYDPVPPWGAFHATGLPSRVAR